MLADIMMLIAGQPDVHGSTNNAMSLRGGQRALQERSGGMIDRTKINENHLKICPTVYH